MRKVKKNKKINNTLQFHGIDCFCSKGLEVDTVLLLYENFTVTFFHQKTKFDQAKICFAVHLDRRRCRRFFQPRVKKLVNVSVIVSFILPFLSITSFEARWSFERS